MKKLLILSSLFFSFSSFANIQKKFNNLQVFGDSLSDTGAFTGAITGYLDNFNNPFHMFFPLPSAISFQTPAYQGRSFTNGKVAIELFAEKIGKTLTPAWNVEPFSFSIPFLGVLYFSGSSKIGNNFALAGAKAASGNSLLDQVLFNKFSLDKQVNAYIKGIDSRNSINNDLFTIIIGGNDILSATMDNNVSFIDNGTDGVISSLEVLYNFGGRHFIIANAPNIALIPLVEVSNKNKARFFSLDYNSKLKEKISIFKSKYPESKITYIDTYELFQNLIAEAQSIGMNVTSPCTSNISDSMNKNDDFVNLLQSIQGGELPFKYVNNCSANTIKDYLFFDYVHTTQWGHEKLANKIYEQVLLEYPD